jgi:hypothetical protein
VDQARALIAAQLAAPGALARAEADLLAAQEAVAQARRDLQRLADEVRLADGQVLTARVHVIHGSEGTSALRLLYRKTTAPSRASGRWDSRRPS